MIPVLHECRTSPARHWASPTVVTISGVTRIAQNLQIKRFVRSAPLLRVNMIAGDSTGGVPVFTLTTHKQWHNDPNLRHSHPSKLMVPVGSIDYSRPKRIAWIVMGDMSDADLVCVIIKHVADPFLIALGGFSSFGYTG
jgi:hypothetical protein